MHEFVFMRPWDMAFVAFNPLITLWPPFTPSLCFGLSFASHPLSSLCSSRSRSTLAAYSSSSTFLVKSPSVTDISPLTWQANSHGPGVFVCAGRNQTATKCTPSSQTLGWLWEGSERLTRSVSFVVRNDQAGSTVDVSKQLDHAGLTAERPVGQKWLKQICSGIFGCALWEPLCTCNPYWICFPLC